MKKRILTFVLVFVLVLSSANAAYVTGPAKESRQHFSTIDPETILVEGVYSESRETVEWDGMIFIVADLERAVRQLKNPSKIHEAGINSRGLSYRYLSSNVFFSKGSQHVLGRITLNPGQSGSIGYGASFSIEYTSNMGVDLKWFTREASNSYTQSYTVTVDFDLTNTTNYLRTAALGSVFMIHYYAIYDNGVNIGNASVYEPYSAYTYWVN